MLILKLRRLLPESITSIWEGNVMRGHFESHEITSLTFDSLSRTAVTLVTDSEDRIIALSDHYAKILNRKKKDII
jgi:hypothetical protein